MEATAESAQRPSRLKRNLLLVAFYLAVMTVIAAGYA